MRSCVLGLFFLAVVSAMAAPRTNEKSLDEHRRAFNQLLADDWDYEMREAPEFATFVGDYRYNDRWSNLSLAHAAQRTEDIKHWLARFEAVDTANFPEQDKISQLIMVQALKLQIEGNRLKTFEMPVDQFFGVHLFVAQMVSFSPFNTTKQYEDYLAPRQDPRTDGSDHRGSPARRKRQAYASAFSTGEGRRAVQVNRRSRRRCEPVRQAVVAFSGRRGSCGSYAPENCDCWCDRP